MLVIVRDPHQPGVPLCFSPCTERCHHGSASKPCPKPGDQCWGDDGDTSCSRLSTGPGALEVSVGLSRQFEWGEKKLFRAEASLLLECKTFFWRSTGEQVDQLSLHAVTWAASQSSQTLSVHHLQLHVHDR